MSRNNHEFQTIRSEGGLLPTSFLGRVRDLEEVIPGTNPETYEVFHGERINEKITTSWNRLLKHWTEFRRASEGLSENETGTGLTNSTWTLHLLRELNFGPLPTSAGPRLGDYTYPINRFLGFVPIHLVGCNVKLDRRSAGVPGASRVNPHSLVQEFLNRSADHLWAIVSNGLQLRILRDTQALSRQSFLEFDLESMFDGEIYSDFVLLWLSVHSTRFQAEKPEKCFLEQWVQEAKEQSVRALGDLHGGVKKAMQVLGGGFISFRKNIELQDALRSGKLKPVEFHNELLRVVYRLSLLQNY
ncbi:MAG: hypothetical protein OXG10_00220 [Candidatus Dadabacteria bacterium]|nr:hypothetical protein [Candidatus Dadabacteria bacterium]